MASVKLPINVKSHKFCSPFKNNNINLNNTLIHSQDQLHLHKIIWKPFDF